MKDLQLLAAGVVALMAACGRPAELPPSREAAIQFLRDRDILHERDLVESAEWNPKNHSWLIILRLPSGASTRWWVDPARKTMELEAVSQ